MSNQDHSQTQPQNYAIAVTGYKQAACVPVEPCPPPGPGELAGEAIASLISPGTELNALFFGAEPFPKFPGYATVMTVREAGEGTAIQPGERVLFMGGHRKYQKVAETHAVKLPPTLDPAHATVARLMGVSMTTLMTTAARPGERVLVTGAGPVGYLAAHLFRQAGYDVAAYEPDEQRRNTLAASGIAAVYGEPPGPQNGGFALAVECSGHEAAVLAATRAVRPGGEVVMVGVPWQRRTDITAHELLHEVFHRYVRLRSGWEWEIPLHASEFRPHSIFGNLTTALRWLDEGRIPLEGVFRLAAPADAQAVYDSLAARSPELFAAFDWRLTT